LTSQHLCHDQLFNIRKIKSRKITQFLKYEC
jgi:hypothetical protein